MWSVNSVFLLAVADCGDPQKLVVVSCFPRNYREEASVSAVQVWKNKLEHPFPLFLFWFLSNRCCDFSQKNSILVIVRFLTP